MVQETGARVLEGCVRGRVYNTDAERARGRRGMSVQLSAQGRSGTHGRFIVHLKSPIYLFSDKARRCCCLRGQGALIRRRGAKLGQWGRATDEATRDAVCGGLAAVSHEAERCRWLGGGIEKPQTAHCELLQPRSRLRRRAVLRRYKKP